MVTLESGVDLIKDPVRITHNRGWTVLGKIGTRHFVLENKKVLNLFNIEIIKHSRTSCKTLKYLFGVQHFGGKIYFSFDHSSVDKDQFIDYLKEQYPEHYEWFLWNPEYITTALK